ncbi:flavin-containing monooxygenase [Nocardia transvalensis]|uniref:flavin-containing monooxygenase n=1 Tax=Nocardia transvalensis TaxID=37333 RepID=UPI00189328A6|nr:NAD(P)/FAD-dependent oxidoreductase [Nocardia transvalensis]MBF6327247.1 NAD(P)/FAD-dependent oxidoreductase [Nocardia transvalensis]
MRTQIAVIGAGFSGLSMAIRLKKAGFSDLLIFEKDHDLGGTWLHNHYPGCAVDVPAMFYSLSNHEKYDWRRVYATQSEILAYQHEVARRFDLHRHLRLNTEIVDFTFDETAGLWRLTAADGRRFEAQLVFAGFGPEDTAWIPDLPGRDLFAGRQLHSREWDDDFDPTGKRIAVVGTGSSAVQIIPELAESAAQLYVFQRSAPYILPKAGDIELTGVARSALKYVPGLNRALRGLSMAAAQMIHLAQQYGIFSTVMEKMAANFRNKQIPDPALREIMTPTYRFGCKRAPNTNTFYPALTKPTVEVIPSALARLTEHTTVSADGHERAVDAVVWTTGFDIHQTYRRLPVTGRNGITIADTCGAQGAETYMGHSIAGFPNFFMILGPYGRLTHTSMLLNIELQTRYLTKIARLVRDRGVRTIEVEPEAQRAFLERAWSITSLGFLSRGGSCANYLQDPTTGRATAWPGSQLDMWLRTRRVRLDDFRLTYDAPARARLEAPARSIGIEAL